MLYGHSVPLTKLQSDVLHISWSHMVLEIAPTTIIDSQLPFEYTITSRSTDVVVMAQPVQNINHLAFKSMFEREKLSENIFNDWFRQLKLVLRVEKKMFVIEQPLPVAPAADSVANVLAEWNALYDAYNEVACLMLGSMTLELNKQFENYSPYKMLQELKSMFEKQAGVERFDLIQTFHACKQEEEHPAKDDTFHHCKEVGHWKMNYPVYLAELLNKKKQVGSASSLGIFTIELFDFPNTSWVYDTGCGTHIGIIKQGFREARKLKQGSLYLYVGNGVRAQVEAIGSFNLVLPNGLVICLDNCHYAPSITRGIVSVHRLVENGFVQCFTDFEISVSKNNVFYFNAIPSNGTYEIDLHDLVPNINSIYNVSTKRAKHNLDSTYLWHYRLAHISKKRIEKLQQKGLLKSTDDESFDQCVSCLSGKMTRKSFPHRPERATDLFGIIHTDVCGPLRHVSRQHASYFITFTDDYSRYGYVYVLKHKHDDYALESAARILNMVSTMKVDKTSYELWYGKVPNLCYLNVWVCEVLVKRDMPDKLQQRSVKCIFIRYPKKTIDYYFYFPPENKIVVARYTEFFEKNLITQEVEGFEPPQEEVILIRRFERTHQAPNHLCLNVEVEEHSIGDLNEPTSYKATMLDLESNKWINAMNAEYNP
nr:hypothetical protein [Tanacetum cinerariifolium]